MPRKKDYSTMNGAQLGRAIVLNDIADYVIHSEDSEDSNVKNKMKQYLLKELDWAAIGERLEELPAEERQKCNYYETLRRYIGQCPSDQAIMIFETNKELYRLQLYFMSTIGELLSFTGEVPEYAVEKDLTLTSDPVTELNILSRIDIIKNDVATSYAIIAFITILSKKLRMPQLEQMLYSMTAVEENVEATNRIFRKLVYTTTVTALKSLNEEQQAILQHTIDEMKKLPFPLDITELKPTDEDIAAAQKNINIKMFADGLVAADMAVAQLDKGGRNWGDIYL